jgi:hypothetical protein
MAYQLFLDPDRLLRAAYYFGKTNSCSKKNMDALSIIQQSIEEQLGVEKPEWERTYGELPSAGIAECISTRLIGRA